MALAGYTTLSILSLIVVVALASGSPVFAQTPVTGTLILDPSAACQGATVQMAATYPGFTTNPCTPEGCGVLFGGLDIGLDLICTEPTYDSGVVTVTCSIVVPPDSGCGEVTLSLAIANHGEVLASASAPLEVLCPCPAAVGGCVQPANNFALLSPWVVALGLVGCIGTAAVIVKKHRP